MAASHPNVLVITSSDDNPQAAVASGSSQSGLTDENPKTIIAAINKLSKEMQASNQAMREDIKGLILNLPAAFYQARHNVIDVAQTSSFFFVFLFFVLCFLLFDRCVIKHLYADISVLPVQVDPSNPLSDKEHVLNGLEQAQFLKLITNIQSVLAFQSNVVQPLVLNQLKAAGETIFFDVDSELLQICGLNPIEYCSTYLKQPRFFSKSTKPQTRLFLTKSMYNQLAALLGSESRLPESSSSFNPMAVLPNSRNLRIFGPPGCSKTTFTFLHFILSVAQHQKCVLWTRLGSNESAQYVFVDVAHNRVQHGKFQSLSEIQMFLDKSATETWYIDNVNVFNKNSVLASSNSWWRGNPENRSVVLCSSMQSMDIPAMYHSMNFGRLPFQPLTYQQTLTMVQGYWSTCYKMFDGFGVVPTEVFDKELFDKKFRFTGAKYAVSV
jgi:hypothetical protein